MKSGKEIERLKLGWIQLRGDSVVWIIIFLLSLISLMAVYSSSNSLAYMTGQKNIHFLFKQARFIGMGLIVIYLTYRIPLGLYRRLAIPAMAITVLLLIMTAISGETINGARRWLKIGGFTIHTSELAKVAVVLYLARIIEKVEFDTFKKFALVVIVPLGLLLLPVFYGSASAGLFIGGVSFIILIIANIKWSYLSKMVLIGAAGLSFIFLLHITTGAFPRIETAINRVKNYTSISNTDDSEKQLSAEELQRMIDSQHQSKMARVAVASVGIIGKGPGNSTQRDLLPHPYSDFIYAIIIEEWGLLLGGLAVIMLYLWFFARSIFIAQECTTKFAALVALGLAITITGQAMLHIFVNLGILPVTGHTLPLISLGGTSLLIMAAAFGILLSVSRTVESAQIGVDSGDDIFDDEENEKDEEDGQEE